MGKTLGILAALFWIAASTASPAAIPAAKATATASFDCAKAATRSEKTICGDASLSKLDAELAAEYRAVLLANGMPKAMRAAQSAWLKGTRDKCADTGCLRDAYAARLDELKRARSEFADLTAGIIGSCTSLAALAEADATHCRVTESGTYGTLGEREQSYAIYCLDAPRGEGTTCEQGGIALFDVDPRSQRASRWLLRVDLEAAGERFGKPELLRTKDGLLLDLSVSIPGTGAFNASALYLRRGERWAAIDTMGWEKELATQLPKGLAVRKGIWPDYRTMRAEAGLYRAKDANCCPTGGTAKIALKLVGDRLALASVKVGPPPR